MAKRSLSIDTAEAPQSADATRRLQFIEFRLFWEGTLNRADLADSFRVSAAQATADLQRYAALAPVMVAALFWKRSTKWGALAAGVWTLATVLGTWYLFSISAPGKPFPVFPSVFARTPGSVTVFGFLPVVPMVLGSALLVAVVSLLTRPPGAATIERYFANPSPSGLARS